MSYYDLNVNACSFVRKLAEYLRLIQTLSSLLDTHLPVCSVCILMCMYHSHFNLFCRDLEQMDSSPIEEPIAATPQRLTPAKFSTAHIKGKARFFYYRVT
jgi:hypothetical protein